MSKGLRQHLKDHYAGESLPPATLEKLCSLVDGDDAYRRLAVGPNRRGRLFAGICETAASIALLAIPFSYHLGKSAGRPGADSAYQPVREMEKKADPNPIIPDLV